MAERVAIITGGARGIGKAVGLALAADGWSIAFCYRTSRDDAEATAAAIRELGAKALPVQADVSDPEACTALTGRTLDELGRIDALINGAGPYHRAPLMKISNEQWHEMFDNNLHPVFYMSRAVAPAMIDNGGGRIVNFSMANADRMVAQPMLTGHYIAKVGVLVLTRSLAKTLGKHQITVNAVSPGFISSGSAPDEELEKMVKNIPAGYIGELRDAVAAVKYLLSDDARYVNGANIHVSGGWGV